MTETRTLPGILLMLAFCVLAPVLDTCAKLASATIPVGQITLARFAVQAMLMIPVAFAMRIDWRLSRSSAGLVAMRAIFLILSTYLFVAGVQVMPIADALALVFVEPFILLILGRLIFGNSIGPRRIMASVVGFLGALLVIQPSIANYGLVALYPLGCAFAFAFYMLATQAMAKTVSPVAQQLHTSLIGTAICLPAIWLADGSQIVSLDPVMPHGIEWVWLFGVGFWAAASHMCMTIALRHAPASTLAPLHYLELVSAVALGYLVFGDFPNALTWAGISVIVGSGLYMIHRERITARAMHATPLIVPEGVR